MQISKKAWHATLTSAFGVGVFAFWRLAHPEALSCAEEMQLFLFSGDYLTSHLTYPGGLAAYAGEFLTQFYNPLAAGAAIVAMLFVLVQRLTWSAMRGVPEGFGARGGEVAYGLSFVVPAYLLILIGDENILAAHIVEVILGLISCHLFAHHGSSDLRRTLVLLIGVPVLYYLGGSAAYLLLTYAIAWRMASWRRLGTWDVMYLIAACEIALSIGLASRLAAYPIDRLCWGIGNYRMAEVPAAVCASFFVVALVAVLAGIRVRKAKLASGIGIMSVLALCLVGTRFSYDEFKYRVMKYDLCLRTRDWKGAIEMGEKNVATSPLELTTINFALAMRGELAERMFEFPQVNSEGLLPVFSREVYSTMMTGDIYFELGMVNTAQRFAFEAQEAIPNHQKSGRLTRRLAEVAIADGHYDLARRYLGVLEKTFAYRSWARQMEELIKDEARVNAHPLYRRLRRQRVQDDFFYSDRELDQMLGLLFQHDKTNRLAVDYLLACELLTRNLPAFVRYVPLLGQLPDGGGVRIPRAYQEALCMAWAQQHTSFDGMPWPIDAKVKQSFVDFARMHSANPKDARLREGYLGSSFWTHFTVNS